MSDRQHNILCATLFGAAIVLLGNGLHYVATDTRIPTNPAIVLGIVMGIQAAIAIAGLCVTVRRIIKSF